ncbi:hypothetical protein FG05_13919 [Fusarium graminearum]|nr:hypothetical protein FG05_13919 [Fusarium graminearum]
MTPAVLNLKGRPREGAREIGSQRVPRSQELRYDSQVTAAKSPRRLGAGWYLGSGGLLFEQTRRPGLSMNLSVVSHLLGTAVIPPWGCVSNSTVESTEKGNSLFCSNPKGAATLQSNVITQSSISPWLENGWSWYSSKDAVPTVLALQGYRLEGTQRKQKWAGGF